MSGAPAFEIAVKRFPIDERLAFFRVVVSSGGDGGGIDRLAALVEMLLERLDAVTSEIKTTLREDGSAFIMAFLADRRFMTKSEMIAFCEGAAREHEETE